MASPVKETGGVLHSALPVGPVVALAPIVSPMQRLQVIEPVTSSPRNRANMVDLPAIVADFAVVPKANERAACIAPPYARVAAG